jgi:hypothetical protein
MSPVLEIGGDSMGPALVCGCQVLVAPVRGEVGAGDVVVLQASGALVLHRVLLTFEEDGERWLIHRGDAGRAAAAAPVSAVVGRAIGAVGAGLEPAPAVEALAPGARRAFRLALWRARAYVLARRVARGLGIRRRLAVVSGLEARPVLDQEAALSERDRAAEGVTVEGVSGEARSTDRPLRIAPSIAWRLIDGEAVVLDLSGQRTLGLNRTASLVWSLLADHDEPRIVEAVVRRFEIDAETARADVRRLLATLHQQGLLVEA